MSAPADRTPVLVGAAALTQREPDPARADEPIALMARALEAAAKDAGAPALLTRADAVLVPRGFWAYADPGRLLAERLGASAARSVLAEIGVLQTTLLARAAADIAAGRADVVLVAGGEAKHREQRAKRNGVAAAVTAQSEGAPDEVLRPAGDILHAHEITRGLAMPVGQYAMIENALRHAERRALDADRDAVANLWAGMSRVAARNPGAWRGEPVAADTIRDASDANPMLAFPYTKLHNSNWNVDQAAGLVFASVATARALGIPGERWVYPWCVAESNHMLPLSQRRECARAHGFALAGEQALAHAGRSADEIAHLELYSCFPSAVRVQCRELGIDDTRTLSVTGGMAFAGGPLNNFVLQAQATMAERLRGDPGSLGLVSAVSGVLTKQGLGLWSSEPPPRDFAWIDVSEEASRRTGAIDLAAEAKGEATVATYTVLFERGRPTGTVLLCDLPDGRRALHASPDPELAARAMETELCKRRVAIGADTTRVEED